MSNGHDGWYGFWSIHLVECDLMSCRFDDMNSVCVYMFVINWFYIPLFVSLYLFILFFYFLVIICFSPFSIKTDKSNETRRRFISQLGRLIWFWIRFNLKCFRVIIFTCMCLCLGWLCVFYTYLYISQWEAGCDLLMWIHSI